MARELVTPDDALALLRELGAPVHLVRHHELVVEAADLLLREVDALNATDWFDPVTVLLGAALHDAGKIEHPDELHVPGHAHEPAGRELLIRAGVPPEVASFCVSHARWREHPDEPEVLLVALADHLWKGKRTEALEALFTDLAARRLGREPWEVFLRLDSAYERVAADGPERLRRSTEP